MIELIDFKMGNRTLSLYVSQELFMPNQTTQLFGEVVKINSNTIVFDIGSGVGPIAIWAALEDSNSIYAVEIVEEQYNLLRKNIDMNKVSCKVNAYYGSFFEPIPKGIMADIIITDCSGMAEKVARTSGWYPPKIPTGGEDGTDNTIAMLEQANNYLNKGGRVYFPIAVGFSNRERILDTAKSNFKNLEKKIEKAFPLKPQQVESILKSVGSEDYIKDLESKKSRYLWKAEIYEVSEPQH